MLRPLTLESKREQDIDCCDNLLKEIIELSISHIFNDNFSTKIIGMVALSRKETIGKFIGLREQYK